MFDNLSERFSKIAKNLTGRGRLSEDNIKDSLREVRMALIEADVALSVVKSFIQAISERAIGQEVATSLSPGQAMIKIVNDELTRIMGPSEAPLNLKTQPPATILMAGLQGSGKTTTVGKLASYIKEQLEKTVLLVSTDVYRPAAIQQLERLATQIDVAFFPSHKDESPKTIAEHAILHAQKQGIDVVIIDTAGRMHIDEAMMDEIKALHQISQPIETLFVVDSMTGQDAANTAKAFDDALPLTGVILTKTDGDARGGAALSIRQITQKPIKFLGTGEKLDALEPFYPERVASRILGMGDVLSLIETAERKIDKKKADKIAKKIKKGGFDFEDFKEQLQQMNNMGGISSLIQKLPNMPNMAQMPQAGNEQQLAKFDAIINSMTVQERRFPDLIKGSRKRRIAKGSGTQVPEVNRLLKQFKQMQKMVKQMSKKGGMNKIMRQMQGLMGGGPGGGPPSF